MTGISRRKLILGSGAAGLAGVLASGVALRILTSPGKRKDLNVLLVVSDSMRADKIGRRVAGIEVTPNLNAFAGEAVCFQEAYAAASWTKCSVASILSGQFPSYHGVISPHLALPDIPTLPGYLADKGYLTIGLTANPVTKPETNQDPSGAPRLTRAGFGYPFIRKSKETGEKRGLYLFFKPDADAQLKAGDYAEGYADTGVIFSGLLNNLDGNLYAKSGHPFFAYLHDMRTHRPWLTPAPLEEVTGKFHEPKEDAKSAHEKDFEALARYLFPEKREVPPEEMIRRLVAINDEAVFLFDMKFGELIDALKARGLYNRTIVVFTADHGDEFYEHGRIGHAQNLYNASLRVPLIVRHPEIAPRTVQARVTNASIFPTVRDLLGDKQTEDATVFSLKPYMAGELPAAKNCMDISANLMKSTKNVSPDGIAVISSPSSCEVFDIVKDPLEKSPLSGRDGEAKRLQGVVAASANLARRDKVQYVVTNLPGMRAASMNPDGTFDMPDGEKANLTKEERDQLKSLGYLN
jgi:arylsulfatase A-like enzyme